MNDIEPFLILDGQLSRVLPLFTAHDMSNPLTKALYVICQILGLLLSQINSPSEVNGPNYLGPLQRKMT